MMNNTVYIVYKITDHRHRVRPERGFRAGTGNQIFSNPIPDLVTGTGMYFLHSGSGQSGYWISQDFRPDFSKQILQV